MHCLISPCICLRGVVWRIFREEEEEKRVFVEESFDLNATMAVVENAPIDSGIGVYSSSPPPSDNSGAGDFDRGASDAQDSSNQNARLGLRLHNHQFSGEGFDHGGNRVKEFKEMFSKLNPMAKEFMPPYLASPKPSYGFENGLVANGFGLNQMMMGLGDGGVNFSAGRRL